MVVLESQKIPLGLTAKNFTLPGTDEKNYYLESFKDAEILVIIFTCNHCPYAQASWQELVPLYQEFKEQGVEFVAINPNDERQYPEDSFEVMKEKVGEWKITFPYLRDEQQEVTRTSGAVCTPDVFVYDKSRKLRYHGRINDRRKIEEKAHTSELKDAILALLSGKYPKLQQPPSMGCSIKWKI